MPFSDANEKHLNCPYLLIFYIGPVNLLDFVGQILLKFKFLRV